MDNLKWVSKTKRELRSPTLIVAFEGWNDAGESATTAIKHLHEHLDGEKIAEINPEIFYDFTETRPLLKLSDSGREIEWPLNDFVAITLPEEETDLIVFAGTEPQLRWRTFTEQIMTIIDEFDVELVITLGALIAEVVHSRPATIYSTSEDPKIMEELSLEPSNYEGPTGIVGVLQELLKTANVSSISLWATIPGYVPHMSSPKAALALVQRIAQVIDYNVPTALLEIAATSYEQQIDELIAEDTDTQEYIAELEQSYDESMAPESGKALIQELEQFLKDRED